MAELLAVAFLGGLITGLSPCIVPVLPVVVAGGSAGTSRARPYLIIAGLVVSFSLTELVGSTVLSALGLPQNFLFWLGIGLLGLLALGLMVSDRRRVDRAAVRPTRRRRATPTQVAASCSASAWAWSSCRAPARSWPPSPPPRPTTASVPRRSSSPSSTRSGRRSPSSSSPCSPNGPSSGWQKLRAHLPARPPGGRSGPGRHHPGHRVRRASTRCSAMSRATPRRSRTTSRAAAPSPSSCSDSTARSANQFAKKAATTAKMATLPELGMAPRLHRHRELVQHAGRQAAVLGPAQGQGGSGRLLDLFVHQLPALAAPRRGLVQGLQEGRPRRGRSQHARVRLRTRRLQRPQRGRQPRHRLPRGHRQQLRHMGRLQQRVLAGRVPDRPHRAKCAPTTSARAATPTMESNIRALLTANGVTTLPPRTDVADKTPTERDHSRELRRLRRGAVRRRDDDRARQGDRLPRARPRSRSTASPSTGHGPTTARKRPPVPTPRSICTSWPTTSTSSWVGRARRRSRSTAGTSRRVDVSGVPRLYTLFSGSALQTGQLDLQLLSGRAGLRLHLRLSPFRRPARRRHEPDWSDRHFCAGTAACPKRACTPRLAADPLERCRSGRRPLALRKYHDFPGPVIEVNQTILEPVIVKLFTNSACYHSQFRGHLSSAMCRAQHPPATVPVTKQMHAFW